MDPVCDPHSSALVSSVHQGPAVGGRAPDQSSGQLVRNCPVDWSQVNTSSSKTTQKRLCVSLSELGDPRYLVFA